MRQGPGIGRWPSAQRRLALPRVALLAPLLTPLLGVAAVPRPGAEEQAASGGPSAAVEAYLSEDSFPGLFLLEPRGRDGKLPTAEGPWSLLAYRGGQRPDLAGEPPASVAAGAFRSWQELREALHAQLGLLEQEPFQTPWGVFGAQGQRLESLEDLKRTPVAFLLEVGVWMWPAVRVGFEQRAEGVGRGSAVLRTLSLRPKVFEVRNFLSTNETEEVMRLGQAQGLVVSKGVMQSADIKKGTSDADFRTSQQAWLTNDMAPVIGELDRRVADLTRVPASHNEAVQLLRYGEGQYYHGHMDWTELELYPDQQRIWVDSQFGFQDRLATVFWYLNDVAEGGETIFPKHGQPICAPRDRGGPQTRSCEGAMDPKMSSCQIGLKVPPRRGTVILWYNFHPSGRGDRNSLHAGCPVGKNLVKWSANKWVRIKSAETEATWMVDHPALKRHGYQGSAQPEAEAVLNANKCQVTFENQAQEAAELLWKDHGGGTARLSTMEPGASYTFDSYRGHEFLFQVGERTSNGVVCIPPSGRFEFTAEFVLRPSRGKGEL